MTDDYARDLHEAFLHIFFLIGDERPMPTPEAMRMASVPVELVGHPAMFVGCPRCGQGVTWATWPEHVLEHRARREA